MRGDILSYYLDLKFIMAPISINITVKYYITLINLLPSFDIIQYLRLVIGYYNNDLIIHQLRQTKLNANLVWLKNLKLHTWTTLSTVLYRCNW